MSLDWTRDLHRHPPCPSHHTWDVTTHMCVEADLSRPGEENKVKAFLSYLPVYSASVCEVCRTISLPASCDLALWSCAHTYQRTIIHKHNTLIEKQSTELRVAQHGVSDLDHNNTFTLCGRYRRWGKAHHHLMMVVVAGSIPGRAKWNCVLGEGASPYLPRGGNVPVLTVSRSG